MRNLLCSFVLGLSIMAIAQDDIVVYSSDNYQKSTKENSSYQIVEDDIDDYDYDEYMAEPSTPIPMLNSKAKKVSVVEEKDDKLLGQDTRRVRYSAMLDLGIGGDLTSGGTALSISTTHGVQLGKYVFVGAGIGYSFVEDGLYRPKYDLPSTGSYNSYRNTWTNMDYVEEEYYNSHAINYYAAFRAYCRKGKWVPYFDVKLGGSTFAEYYQDRSTYYWRTTVYNSSSKKYETRSGTIGYDAEPDKDIISGLYLEVGFGIVMYKYFDVRLSWTASGEGGYLTERENSLQLKVGVRL